VLALSREVGAAEGNSLLEARNVSKAYLRSKGWLSRGHDRIIAVDDVSFSIARGESFGLVGESGCGKTTLARMLLRLIDPTTGSIWFDGIDLGTASGPDLLRARARIQMVFQDPYASLNPRKSLLQILSKPYRLHKQLTRQEMRARVLALLEDVGLAPGQAYVGRYPHELSGGQRQRVVIARAIALQPDLVVADEPVSALDVSVRAQILNLLLELKREHHLTLLFISHDLSIVRSLCERVAVMYLGRIVEIGSTEEVFGNPLHPYTRALLASTPVPDPRLMQARTEAAIEGEIPSAAARPPGCLFHTRCPMRGDGCSSVSPLLRRLRPKQQVACHFADGHPIVEARGTAL
jgi:oligopeptide/dipeptide ABC transporter ATP-binding protein